MRVLSFIPSAVSASVLVLLLLLIPSVVSLISNNSQAPSSKTFNSAFLHHPASLLRSSATQRESMEEENMSAPSAPFRLAYVTDVEGNLDYFIKFVNSCPILKAQFRLHKTADPKAEAEGRSSGHLPHDNDIESLVLDFANPADALDEPTDNYYFVFGGDSVDKGTGDIRLNRCLVDFKKQYPDRVFLLVGNRDLNKLRFSAELSPADLARDVWSIPGPHWDPSAPTLAEYLQKIAKETIPEEQQVDLQSLHTRVNRLKYMLKHTLGCPKTFEFRRTELSILQNRPMELITDDEVVDNFIYEVQEGSLHDYFHHAQVAVIIGNTLFCHGAVDKDTMQFVPSPQSKFENPPSRPDPLKIVSNAHEWVDSLNEFYRLGLEDHAQRPYWNDMFNSRGGESLMALQNRPAMWGRSIISNCYGDGGVITNKYAAEHREDPRRLEDSKTNPLCFEKVCSDPLDQTVATWLLDHGIQRVVVGHKPTGDCPSVLSSAYTGVEIVSADTSFSDTSASDSRGSAVGVVQLVGPSSRDNQLHLSGLLQNGKRYACAFPRLKSKFAVVDTNKDDTDSEQVDTYKTTNLQGDPFLGRQLKDGDWWIKVKTTEDDLYCLTRGNGRKVEYKFISASSLVDDLVKGRDEIGTTVLVPST